ncbi:MAG: ABC transporter permease [Verrucomicrobia bacterium]|nr:ABC transporter permease [Verrucomicrobiota bacterium]
MNDFKLAFRQLLKNPGFTAVAVLTLALGIGANTAIFSVVNGVLLRPLPYPQPGQLVTIRKELPPDGRPAIGGGALVSGQEFAAWREQSESLALIAAYGSEDRTLTGSGPAEPVRCGTATASLFPLLGVPPALGRLFVESDEMPQGPQIALLSHGLWQRRFGGDPGILGQSLTLNGLSHTIVGVLPASFQFPEPNEVWLPMSAVRGSESADGAIAIHLLKALGRLRPGFSLEQAQAELQLIASRVTLPGLPGLSPASGLSSPVDSLRPPVPDEGPVRLPFPQESPLLTPQLPVGAESGEPVDVTQAAPPRADSLPRPSLNPQPVGLEDPFGGGKIQLVGLHEHLVANVRRSVWVLMSAVGFVLLIACANVANLLLTRAVVRRREIAVRLALGATRWRITRQFLVESLILALAGAGLGLVFSWWGLQLLASLVLTGREHLQSVALDLPVLMFTLVMAVATGLIFGLVPALRSAGTPVNGVLKESGSTVSEGRGRNRLRGILIIVETALALVLLVGAGLLINSFVRLRSVDVGFEPDGLLTFQVNLADGPYSSAEARGVFFQQLREKLSGLPGVESVALTGHLPLSPYSIMSAVSVAGEPRENYAGRPAVSLAAVTENYFETLRMPVRQGRAFTSADRTQRAVVVNEQFAREYFPGVSPVGRQLNDFAGRGGTYTIVGVVSDVRQDGFEGQVTPEIYLLGWEHDPGFVSVALKCAGDPGGMARAVREQVQALDPNLVLYDLMPLRERLDATTTPRRANLILLGGFALLALGLAVVGIYSVMSFVVCQRTREIGVRMTLGAPAAEVTALILRQGMGLVLVGLVLGLGFALVATRAMASLLFEVSATDPLTLMAVTLILAVTGLVACWLPARRAARVDPMMALRSE